jgi:dihydrodipicolinate synthase/N-acetylneuraminate lyase
MSQTLLPAVFGSEGTLNLRGFIPVLTTPFHADASIDESSLRKRVDFCIGGGVAGLCAPAFCDSSSYHICCMNRRRKAVAAATALQGASRIFIVGGTFQPKGYL